MFSRLLHKVKSNYEYSLFILLLLFGITGLHSQPNIETDESDANKIVTDRPSQNESPALVSRGWMQIETGVQDEFDKDKENKIKKQSLLYNTTLWKYGVSNNFELRLITEYGGEKIYMKSLHDTTVTVNYSGLKPIHIGSKIAIQKEHRFIPEISFLAHLTLPYFGQGRYKNNSIVPRFRFLFCHTINKYISLSYNLGAEWENESNMTTGIYTACLDFCLSKKLAVFIESYGYAKEKYVPDNRVDCGLTFQFYPNFQIDCAGGIGLNEASPNYFVCGGLSLKFEVMKNALYN